MENSYQWSNLNKCFRCGQIGHLSNDCLQRKTIAFMDEEKIWIKIKVVFKQEEEILKPDDGKSFKFINSNVLLDRDGNYPK